MADDLPRQRPDETPEQVTARQAAWSEAGSYPRPEHGWTCFHCGETFHVMALAAAHFGSDPAFHQTLCQIAKQERGLGAALRKAEAELERLRSEERDQQQHYAMQAQHTVDLRHEEEKGYARGLADAGLSTSEPILRRICLHFDVDPDKAYGPVKAWELLRYEIEKACAEQAKAG